MRMLRLLIFAGWAAAIVIALACSADDPSSDTPADANVVSKADASAESAAGRQPINTQASLSGRDRERFSRYDRDVKEFMAEYYDANPDKVDDRPIAASCTLRAAREDWNFDSSLMGLSVLTGHPWEGDFIETASYAIEYATGDDARFYCESKLRSLVHRLTPTPTLQWNVRGDRVDTTGSPPEGLEPGRSEDPSNLSIWCDNGELHTIVSFADYGSGRIYFSGNETYYQIDNGPTKRLKDQYTSRPGVDDVIDGVRVADAYAFVDALLTGETLVMSSLLHNANSEPGPEIRTTFDVKDLGRHVRRLSCMQGPRPTPTELPTPSPDPLEPTAQIEPAYKSIQHDLGPTVSVPDGWILYSEDERCLGFVSDDNVALAALCAEPLAADVAAADDSLSEYAMWRHEEISAGLGQADVTLFESVSFGRSKDYGIDHYRFEYRLQDSPDTCVEERVMLMGVSAPDIENARGVTWRVSVCAPDLERYIEQRQRMLESFTP